MGDFLFITNFQVMLMLLVHGSHFEYERFRAAVLKMWSQNQHHHHLELVRNTTFGPQSRPTESETLIHVKI